MTPTVTAALRTRARAEVRSMFICPPLAKETLPMTAICAVGFGVVAVTRDDETMWEGDDERVWVRRFEKRAAADPDHDWRIRYYGPLSEATYQRQGPKTWALIETGLGFA